MSRSVFVLVLTAVVVSSFFFVGTAGAIGDDIAVSFPENRYEAGEDGIIELYVDNRDIRPLQSVTLEVGERRAPVKVKTAERPVGTVADLRGPFLFDIVVDEDAEPGEYRMNADVTYARQVGERTLTTTRTERIDIIIEERAGFEVVETRSDAKVGDEREITMVLRNNGTEIARDPSVVVRSPDPEISFASGASFTDSFAGNWEVDEEKEISYVVNVDGDTEPRPYTLRTVVEFRDSDGVEHVSDGLRSGVEPIDSQGFGVRNVSSDLRVGEDGTVEGELINMGPENVTGTAVVFDSPNPNVNARDPESATGNISVGESGEFRFTVGVSSSAEPGEREMPFLVRYRNDDGDLLTSELTDLKLDVAPEVEPFEVEPVNATVPAGDEALVELRLTNTANRTWYDVQATAFTNRPLTSDDDEAFVEEMEPGDETTLFFRVEASRTATAKSYPMSLDIRYEDEDGDTLLSDTRRVAVEVAEPEDGLPVVPLVGLVAVVAVLAAGWWWRRG